MKTPMTFPQTVKALDKVFSEYIRIRDPFCVLCHAKTTDNSHLFSRMSKSTRWNEKACNGNCNPCNLRHDRDPKPYTDWFITKYGQEEYDKLKQLHFRSDKNLFSRPSLLGMIDEYKTKLQLLKHES